MTFAKDFHLNSMAVENTNIIQTRAGEIVLYQPDANTHLEVRVDDETGWLTQQQIADRFGKKTACHFQTLKQHLQRRRTRQEFSSFHFEIYCF